MKITNKKFMLLISYIMALDFDICFTRGKERNAWLTDIWAVWVGDPAPCYRPIL